MFHLILIFTEMVRSLLRQQWGCHARTQTKYNNWTMSLSSSSSSSFCHGVGPLADPFRSQVSRSLFKGLSKCSLVCFKLHTPYRPQHPLCKWGHQWKNWQTRIPSQPTSGDTNTTDEKQKAKKTLDLRPSWLRRHRWMVTLPSQHNRIAN
jgi:hypothetical protein